MNEVLKRPIVVLVVKSLEGRGAERSVAELADGFLAINAEVHILYLEDKIELPIDDRVKLHFINYNELKFKLRLNRKLKYKAIAREIDSYVTNFIGTPDLIHANLYKINWIMSYSKLPNIVNILHTNLSNQFEKKIKLSPSKIKKHLKHVYGAHPCTVVSEGARKDMIELIGDVTPTEVIHNPCKVSKIKKASNSAFDFSKLGIKSKEYIVHVGSFDPVKNHKLLLEAFAKTTHKIPLVLVGKGKLESEIKQLAIDLEIDKWVVFMGFLANPYPIISQAKFLVLSSKFEGFGLVIAEALVLDTPVISTDCPYGPRELLPESNLVKSGSSEELAKLMDMAILNPSDFQTSLSLDLSPENLAVRHLEFIRKLTEDQSHH